jgi:serine/threonine-protein kinase
MGTPEYMAPEQAAGKPADPRSDIYAAGSILYEMLTSVPPYDGENVMEVLHKKANQAPRPIRELRPDLPPEVESLVTRTMARSPADRPQTMEEVAREIAAILPTLGDAHAVKPAPMPRRVTELVRKPLDPVGLAALGIPRPVVAAGAGILLLLAVVVVVRGGATTRSAPPLALKPLVAPPVTPVPPPVVAVAPAPVAPTTPAQVEAAPAEQPRTDTGVKRPPVGGKAKVAGLSPVASRQLLDEGQNLVKLQRYDEARSIFNKLLDARPGTARGGALIGLADIAFQQRNYTEMVRRAKEAVDARAGVPALILLGEANFKLQNYADAVKAYDEALKLAPKNTRARQGLELAKRRLN